ncbi:hypothetical protein DVR12_19855 [Chitinophaga silvatica]|uniref:Uncharacterized protein n=1 Tax=Chitinophaga silvatica TaxID=2282649 RepID=A0A3E1Y5H3_9BACT|nr:hypothetical protein [Chitinophaga silvatica]RFS19983.1 hypothetical protein DVR12_19855 [Chitinophaga silvatica]
MGETKNKSSVLLSIFKRKGGEGPMTKIISDDNKQSFLNQISLLIVEEQPLICFKRDESNWLLITNTRIIEEKEGIRLAIPYCELVEVNLAMQEEFRDKVMNKKDFTRLVLKDTSGRSYIVRMEKGEPYQGIYQMLHHIVSSKKAAH